MEILEVGRGYVAAVRTDVITLEIDLDKWLKLTELVFSRTEEDDTGQAVLRKNRTQSFGVALSGAAHALLL